MIWAVTQAGFKPVSASLVFWGEIIFGNLLSVLDRYFGLEPCDEHVVVGIVARAIEVMAPRETTTPIKLAVLNLVSDNYINLASRYVSQYDNPNSPYFCSASRLRRTRFSA